MMDKSRYRVGSDGSNCRPIFRFGGLVYSISNWRRSPIVKECDHPFTAATSYNLSCDDCRTILKLYEPEIFGTVTIG